MCKINKSYWTPVYGRKGQAWAADFVKYMVEIATHPVYAGMPDAIKDDGKIQWEAPSNRSGGQYQYTHHKRRDWWREKARTIDIDPESDQWISTVAKRIHPTGEKPCKRCGRVMRIGYVYPNGYLQRRFYKTFGKAFEFDPLEPITSIIQRVNDQFGNVKLAEFQTILATPHSKPPADLDDLDSWLSWLEEKFIPSEPPLLSPGAMSNAPDRFDGFHSFNLCCRKKVDTGRHDSNMRSYTTDRRVFEYWSDGDWIAADRMMGLIASRFRKEDCADGSEGPPTADHIGPLSLGFSHHPHFRLLSRAANSAKNNRMTFQDVSDLLKMERVGTQVVSWYAKALWDQRKKDVTDEELALRLSKQMRDNQRAAMYLLVEVHRSHHLTFLASLLNLECADFKTEFQNPRVRDFVTVFESVEHTSRQNKYTAEQKARRVRIGLEALRTYGQKENRHSSIVTELINEQASQHLSSALGALACANKSISELDTTLQKALASLGPKVAEKLLREVSSSIPNLNEIPEFQEAKEKLRLAMGEIASEISDRWSADRYVRTNCEE